MIELIDTHQHLLYADRLSYPWTSKYPGLAGRSFTLEDYQSLVEGNGVKATIFMEVNVPDEQVGDEATLVHELSQRPGSPIRGLIASCRPESDDGFDEWLGRADELNIVGYRRVLHVADDGLSTTKTFRDNVAKVGRAGRVFDLCFFAHQLHLAADLVRACPGTVFVLDHFGNPDIAGGKVGQWKEAVAEVASAGDVHCKMSGIMVRCAPGKADHDSVKPCFDHLLECFGPDRIVWGSDWPVVNLASSLPDWLNITQRLLAGLSADDADKIGTGNAMKVYGLEI